MGSQSRSLSLSPVEMGFGIGVGTGIGHWSGGQTEDSHEAIHENCPTKSNEHPGLPGRSVRRMSGITDTSCRAVDSRGL